MIWSFSTWTLFSFILVGRTVHQKQTIDEFNQYFKSNLDPLTKGNCCKIVLLQLEKTQYEAQKEAQGVNLYVQLLQ